MRVDKIVAKVQISKTKARYHLEYRVQTKLLTVELNHVKIGRPERLYKGLGK
ncbi:hypothetical protein [Gilliamella sp. wkB112]|uniref:hypothetical protein n=1 Tax=Gilliamella sp. wkB112 TaxID=3120257 RepID=UPI003FA5BB57